MRVRRKIAFSITLVVLIALMTEVGFRVAFMITGQDPDSMRLFSHDPGMKLEGRYVSHPFLPFALRQDSDHEILWTPPPWPELEGDTETRVWRIHHNSWGFRGPEVTLEKPAGTLRVPDDDE